MNVTKILKIYSNDCNYDCIYFFVTIVNLFKKFNYKDFLTSVI